MDIAIVMFVLIVTLSRPGNSLLAFNDVENVNDYANTNAPIDTKEFEKNVKKAKEPLMQLIPMENIEEIEKFGKREINHSNMLPSLSRKARCKHPRISWRSRKAQKLRGVSTTPLKHVSVSRSTSANGGMKDSFKKPDIRAPSVARARKPTNNFGNPRTTKRENEHGVEEIIMLPPQTVDSVIVISEGARIASDETPKSYVCGTFDEKDRQRAAAEPMKIGIPLNSARETDNPHYERNGSFQEVFQNFPLNKNQMTLDTRQPFGINQNVPFPNLAPKISQKHISHPSYAGKSTYQDTLVGNARIQNNRKLDEPFVDDEESLSDEHDVIKAPTNHLELDDCIKNYGLEHCIPVPGELRSYVQNHQSEAYDQRPITSIHSVHANPLTEQPDNDLDVHAPTTAEEETAAKSDEDDYLDTSTPGNVHGQNVDYASIYEDTDETKKPHDPSNESKENEVTTSVSGATEVPEIDGPAHPAMGLSSNEMAHEQKSSRSEESSTEPCNHAGERNQVIGSGGSPEDRYPDDERTSMIRSTDMPKVGFKRLPFIPVKERVFKDGRWAEKSSLLGGSRDRFEPKSRKAHNDVVESAVGKSSPVSSEFVTNQEENEKTPIKYYSPASRLLAYRKKIQVPKVMFHLEEKTKVSPRAPGLSPVADSSIPVTSTAHKLPLPTENGLKFTKDWSKSTPPALPYTNLQSSEKFRKKPDSLGNSDLHDDHEELYDTTRSETGFKTILKEDPAEQRTEQSQVSESSLDTAKNSKSGTRYQQIPNKQMIEPQNQVSNYEQSSLIDQSPSATPEYDPTYFGKISLTSAKSLSGKMSDLTDTDLFYIGDGVKIPLKLTRMSDGSWGLSISEKISESFVKQKCPCNVPNEGDIVRERRRQKKNTSLTENTGLRPTPKNHFLLDAIKSSISDVDEPKERRTRSFLETDLHTTSSSPVTKFVEKYNPKNISNSSGPRQNSVALMNNNIEIIASINNEDSLSTTPDSKCTKNGKRTINDISPENEPPLDYDHDVTESLKKSTVAEDENWTIVRGTNEIINGAPVTENGKKLEYPVNQSKNSKSAQNVGSTINYEEDKVNDPSKNEDNVNRNPIDHSMNSTNVPDTRSMMEYQDNIIEPNLLNLYDVPEREDSNIMENPTTNEMNSHFAENPSHPMSSRSPAQPEPSKIDNVLQAENDEVMDRWSWVRDFVDSRRKHNVVMTSQDVDEAILLKIDNILESENAKVTEYPIDTAENSNSAQKVATTMNGPKNGNPVKNLNPMLDHGKIVQNRETLIDQKKLKERDDYNFFRMMNVKAKSDHRRDNPILKRTRLINKKKINARPYRYQQYIDEEAQERMDVMTGVLYWLKEVFFEASAESDD